MFFELEASTAAPPVGVEPSPSDSPSDQCEFLAKSRMLPQAEARNATAKTLQHTIGHAGQLGSVPEHAAPEEPVSKHAP